MAFFIDLETSDSEHEPQPQHDAALPDQCETGDARRANYDNGLIKALNCYPILESLVPSLDLVDMDSLSRTCHMAHFLLLLHRPVLIKKTICCYRDQWQAEQRRELSGLRITPLVCARDRVSKCEKCNNNVCRNCKSNDAHYIFRPTTKMSETGTPIHEVSLVHDEWICALCAGFRALCNSIQKRRASRLAASGPRPAYLYGSPWPSAS